MIDFRMLYGSIILLFLTTESSLFANEIPEKIIDAWKRYDAFTTTLSGSMTLTEEFKSKDTTYNPPVKTLSIAQTEGCRRLQLSDGDSENVIVFNPKYAFMVQRNNASAGWYLQRIQRDPKPLAEDLSKWLEKEGPGMFFHNVRSLTGTLFEFFGSSEYRILEQSETTLDGVVVYNIRFERIAPVPNDVRGRVIVSGVLLLDPKRSYVLRKAVWNTREAHDGVTVLTTTPEYDNDTSVTPIPKRSTLLAEYSNFTGYKYTSTTKVDFQLKSNVSFPADYFSLTNFALPEPEGLEFRTHTNLKWWLMGAGACCLLMGLGLRRWLRWNRVQKNAE